MADIESYSDDVNSQVSFSDATIISGNLDNVSVHSQDWPDILEHENMPDTLLEENEDENQVDVDENSNESEPKNDQEITRLVTDTIMRATRHIKEETWACNMNTNSTEITSDHDVINTNNVDQQNKPAAVVNQETTNEASSSSELNEENMESPETEDVPELGMPSSAEEYPMQKSVKYLEKHGIFRLFQSLSADVVYHRPDNPLQFMVDKLKESKQEAGGDDRWESDAK